MNKGNLIRSLTIGTGLLLALAVPAQAGSDRDVVQFRQPYPLANAKRVAVQGRHVGVGASSARGTDCRFPPASLSLAPRERAVELREVALNRRTCRAVFERGVPPRWARGGPQSKEQATSGDKRRRGTASGVQTLATAPQWSGYSRAWYRDARTGKVVTQVKDGADWNTRNGCVSGSNLWFLNSADKPGGWFEVSHRWSIVNNICRYVLSSVNAHFRNNSFTGCSGGPPVDTFYSRVRFIGYADGNIRGSKSSWNDPSCKDVLIAYYALYRR
jgi:hypothetical protein